MPIIIVVTVCSVPQSGRAAYFGCLCGQTTLTTDTQIHTQTDTRTYTRRLAVGATLESTSLEQIIKSFLHGRIQSAKVYAVAAVVAVVWPGAC